MCEKRKRRYWEGFVKPWTGLGSGLYEVTEDRWGNTFRAVTIVHIADARHGLHAFRQKSKCGIATPQPDVDVIERRLKAVLARHGLIGRS